MNNIKITTLTPVHIGSGIEFQGNVEYLWFADRNVAVVLDDQKVLDIIGPENLSHWVSCIEKGEPLLSLLRQRMPDVNAESVAKRIVTLGKGSIDAQKIMREQLHSTNGTTLMPGSSLKGALRTAVWAHEIAQNTKVANDRSLIGETKTDRKSGKDKFEFKDAALAKRIFGQDPNRDIFRLWQVGDAHFTQKTAVYRTEVVNKMLQGYAIKQEITQQIEAIPAGSETEATWKYNTVLQKAAAEKAIFNKAGDNLPPSKLFPLVNKHTISLLEAELKFWKVTEGAPAVLGTYIDHIERLINTAKDCADNSCVLRLGWGTGFLSMTGNWHTEMTDDNYFDLVAQLRPTHDETLQYPKTTRMIAGGEPLGFVKIEAAL